MPRGRRPTVDTVFARNSFGRLIRDYLTSPKFRGYAASTQQMWGAKLWEAARPDVLGRTGVDKIRPSLIQAFLDRFIQNPSSQAVAYAAIKQLEGWAIVRDRLPRAITTGCEVEDFDGGHIPWTNEQVAIGERYAPQHLSRIITMACNTGQRGSDIVRMRWTDIENYNGRSGILVTQKKTNNVTWVPFTQGLSEAMARWERRPGFIFLRGDGMPWAERKELSKAWERERDSNADLAPLRDIPFKGKLKDLVLHGLRGTACVRLLRAGANTRQISDMIGMSEEMVRRYTRFSEQKQNAIAAVIHLDRTPREPAKKDALKNGG